MFNASSLLCFAPHLKFPSLRKREYLKLMMTTLTLGIGFLSRFVRPVERSVAAHGFLFLSLPKQER